MKIALLVVAFAQAVVCGNIGLNSAPLLSPAEVTYVQGSYHAGLAAGPVGYGALSAPAVTSISASPAIVASAPIAYAAPVTRYAEVPTVHHVQGVADVPVTRVNAHPGVIQKTVDVASPAVKTQRYEVRRPAIQKQFYDIEERVVVRPAGSAVVELEEPLSRTQKGPSVIQATGGSVTLTSESVAVPTGPTVTSVASNRGQTAGLSSLGGQSAVLPPAGPSSPPGFSAPVFSSQTSAVLPPAAPSQGSSFSAPVFASQTSAVLPPAAPSQGSSFSAPVFASQTSAVIPPAAPGQGFAYSAPVFAGQGSAGQSISFAAPAQTVTVGAPAPAVSVSAPVQAVPVSAPVQAVSISAPVQAVPVSAPVQTVSVSAPVQAAPVSAPVQAVPVSAPVQTVSISAPVQAVPVSAPVQTVSVSAPVQAAPVSAPVQAVSVSAPVQAVSVQSAPPVQTATVTGVSATSDGSSGISGVSFTTPVPLFSNDAVPVNNANFNFGRSQLRSPGFPSQGVQAGGLVRPVFQAAAPQVYSGLVSAPAQSISQETVFRTPLPTAQLALSAPAQSSFAVNYPSSINLAPQQRFGGATHYSDAGLQSAVNHDNQQKLIQLLTARGGVADVGFGRSGSASYPVDAGNVRARVVSATPAPAFAAPTGERVNTRRVVVSRPVETLREVEVAEPVTKYERVHVAQPTVIKTASQDVVRVPTSVPVYGKTLTPVADDSFASVSSHWQ